MKTRSGEMPGNVTLLLRDFDTWSKEKKKDASITVKCMERESPLCSES